MPPLMTISRITDAIRLASNLLLGLSGSRSVNCPVEIDELLICLGAKLVKTELTWSNMSRPTVQKVNDVPFISLTVK